MERSLPAAVPKALIVAGLLAVCALGAGVSDAVAATMRLSWSSDTEADLSGYRLRYGTAPGSVDGEVDTGSATNAQVAGLVRGVTYYFSVVAYDASGNESAPSTEVTARLATDLSAPPVIESAMETSSQSIYAVRSQARSVQVHGQNFDPGATVDLGADIAVAPPALTPEGDLLVGVSIPADAAAGPRTVTVSNPDLGIGSGANLITIVKSPDADGDCAVDIVDLNTLARAWNQQSNEPRYAAPVDLDGDGYVGPDDLTIFVTYYGREFRGCP
jgi:fibronectin type III domain protein